MLEDRFLAPPAADEENRWLGLAWARPETARATAAADPPAPEGMSPAPRSLQRPGRAPGAGALAAVRGAGRVGRQVVPDDDGILQMAIDGAGTPLPTAPFLAQLQRSTANFPGRQCVDEEPEPTCRSRIGVAPRWTLSSVPERVIDRTSASHRPAQRGDTQIKRPSARCIANAKTRRR